MIGLYYFAKSTNDYGENIHKCLDILTEKTYTEEHTNNIIYQHMCFNNTLTADIRAYPNRLVLDTSGDTTTVRQKTEPEYTADEIPIKFQEIKTAFENHLLTGVYIDFLDKRVDADETSIIRWSMAVRYATKIGAEQMAIRTYDDTVHTITFEQLTQITLTCETEYQINFAKKWELQNQAAVCRTREELNNIVW